MKKSVLCFFLLVGELLAAPPPEPSAGIIEREIENEYEKKPLKMKKEIPQIKIDIPDERLEMSDQEKIFIRKIEFQGTDSISDEELARCVDGYLGQELSIKDIYKVCDCIEQYYASKGLFLARAYPPPQKIQNETLIIRVLEGCLGAIHVEGNHYYSTDFILRYFRSLQGKPLSEGKFVRALMLLNENSDLSAGAVFEKGTEIGTADVTVRVMDKRPIHLYLNENNYGRKLTTDSRFGGRVDYGSLGVYGDLLSIAEVVGFPLNALYFTDVRYIVPLNANGTFFELAYLFSKFKIEELMSLHLKGNSQIATVKATHGLTRTRDLSIDLSAYFDFKQIENFTLGHLSSLDKLRVLGTTAFFDIYDPLQGRDFLTIRAEMGLPDFLWGLKAIDSKSSRRGGGGRFVKMNADYDRLQKLPWSSVLYLHASGQWSPYKLTVPEQIYIGGSDTVRGFSLATGLGDSGYYGNLELRVPIPFLADKRFFMAKKTWREVVQVVGFIDTGGVFFHSGPDLCLTGAGFGVRIDGIWRLSLSLDVGYPLNHHHLSTGAVGYLKITGQPF